MHAWESLGRTSNRHRLLPLNRRISWWQQKRFQEIWREQALRIHLQCQLRHSDQVQRMKMATNPILHKTVHHSHQLGVEQLEDWYKHWSCSKYHIVKHLKGIFVGERNHWILSRCKVDTNLISMESSEERVIYLWWREHTQLISHNMKNSSNF